MSDPIYIIIGAVVSDMASKTSSRAVSTRSASPRTPPDNVDHFLSIFQRPQKIHVLKTRQNTISSENLLKKTPIVRVTSIREKDQQPFEGKGHPWNTGFIQRIPYAGVLALFAVILCAIADAVILWKSNNQEVDSWSVSPSVLLAILSAVANICLQFARSQGVVIAWWRKALHGATLNDLNCYWESGDGVIAAAMSGRDFNWVALATLVASTVFFDGPLLQRASIVISRPTTKMVNVTAPIAQEMPYGYTGLAELNNPALYSIIMNQSFAQAVNSFSQRTPMTTEFTGCVGTCTGTVKAAGLAMNCSTDSLPWKNNQSLPAGPDGVNGSEVFSSSFTWISGNTTYFAGVPLINYELQYATGRSAAPLLYEGGQTGGFDSSPNFGMCNGTLVRKSCSLFSATLEYPITLINSTVSLGTNSSNFAVDHLQAYGNFSDFFDHHDLNALSVTTLGGVSVAAQNMFGSRAVEDVYLVQMNGSLASQYAVFETGNGSFEQTQNPCAINWGDPTTEIMDSLNEIMFRTALSVSNVSKYSVLNASISEWWTSYYEAFPVIYPNRPNDTGIPIPQLIAMEQTSNITVFQSHYSYLAAALGIMALGVLVVMPTFYGFWELGRDASLNPLEVAKAFNAEFFHGQGSNAPVRHLAKGFGDKKVKYGEVVDEGATGNNAGLNGSDIREHRLELADPSRVIEPKSRKVYV